MEILAIDSLVGKTLSSIEVSESDDEIIFKTTEGETFKMYHAQDCCESVSLDDIIGDLADLIGSPILHADERESDELLIGQRDFDDSFTWTFYRLSTIKGTVTLRWYGASNGYYSESVDFVKL